MKIGLQLNPQVSTEKPRDSLMPTLINQARIADEVGFDAVSMGDHYNIPGLQRLHQVPALARLSGELEKCSLGTAVTLVGLNHPVTIANELASLDVIHQGKTFFSFGLGYREEELAAFHLTRAERLGRFIEGVEIIKRLWTEDHVSHQGKAFQLKDVTIDPKPLQKPRPEIWIAANSNRAVERAASLGDGWLIGPHSAIEELEEQVRLFKRAWAALKKSEKPMLPIIRETFVAKTREEAIRKARPCLEQLYRNIYIKWKQHEAMNRPDELQWNFEKLSKNRFILGTPNDCIEQIEQYHTRLGTDFILVRFDWTPGLAQPDILRSMELFGQEVIPHFQKSAR